MEEGKKTEKCPEIKELLTALIESHKAGSPTDSSVYWISLKPVAIAKIFQEQHQIKVSNGLVKRLLKELGYSYRKQSKQLATGSYAHRDEQFKITCSLILIMSLDSPVLSIDCKKKERLGNLYRNGKCFCTKAVKVYDHDYEHLSEGKVIPHGVYDLQANKGYVSIGGSSETADFIIDNLHWWWKEYGIHQYPVAKNILLLCDAGGANSYRHHLFKHRLMKFEKETGLSVIVCHYPPYCSKWNPIEHRLFSQVHKAMEGVAFSDYQTIQKLIEQTSTKTGLSVVVRLNLKVVVILAGINDIAGNTGPMTPEQTFDNIVSMAQLARSNGIKVVLSSVLPAYDFAWRPGLAPAEKVVALNKMIKEYADKNNLVYLDYFTSMADERNGLKKELGADGVHPNLAGYRIMEPLAEKAIAEALKKK